MDSLSERVARELEAHPRPLEADEAKHHWLTVLLDAYHILSTGASLALSDEEARRRRQGSLRRWLRLLLSPPRGTGVPA